MAIRIRRVEGSRRSVRGVLVKSLNEARRLHLRTAFLCHSHRDSELAKGLVSLLAEADWDVYVDWEDTAMPEVPSRETASRIQEKIVELDYFLFLATSNSISSRWCPWEIGYADGKKDIDHILIVPTADGSKTHGNEYIQLYRHVDFADTGQIGVWRPGYTHGGVLIKNL